MSNAVKEIINQSNTDYPQDVYKELLLLLLSLKSLQDEQHSDWCDLEDEHCTCGAKPRNNLRAETRSEITKIMGGK